MNRKIKLLVLILTVLIIAIAISGCSTKEEQENSSVNNEVIDENTKDIPDQDIEGKLPAFNLKDLEGKEVSSEIFKDYKMTIVSIWQSTCGPCMNELEALNTIYDEYKDKGVNVIGIAVDDVEISGDEGVKKIAEILELKFTNIISDSDYLVELIKYVEGTPTAFIVGEEGQFLMEPKVGSNGTEKDIEAFRDIIEKTIQ